MDGMMRSTTRPGGLLVALLWTMVLSAATTARTTAAGEPGRAAEPEAAIERIALGSCVKQDRPQPIWPAVLRFEPDVMLMLGDNVYGDTEDMAVLRAKYDRLDDDPGFAALRRAVPLIGVWDDHDYGVNDGGREYPRRRESQQVFCDFFRVPADDPLRRQEGIHRSITLGPPGRRVQFICLDTRFHRSPLAELPRAERVKGEGPYRPSDDPEATVLGPAQWAWLATTLREPADVRIILSSIQVAAIEHGWEHWGNFPGERARLLRTIRDADAAGVIIVSGDRHSAEISRIPSGAEALRYPLLDLTASSLNQPKKVDEDREPNRHRLGDRYHGSNFGTIAIAWGTAASDDTRLTLAIRDEQGRVVTSTAVALAELSPTADAAAASPR
jgi:alkaline phosphatase D